MKSAHKMVARRLALLAAAVLSLALSASAAGAPVVFDGKTLLTIENSVGSFTPDQRAKAVSDRLALLSKNPAIKADSFTVSPSDSSADIVAGGAVIISITEADARAAGKPRQAVAAEYVVILQKALEDSRKQHSWEGLIIGIAWSAFGTAILLFILKLLQLGYRRLRKLIDSWLGTRIRGVRIQKLELLAADRIAWAITSLLRLVYGAAILLMLYFYLSIVLSIFPATRSIAAGLFGYLDSGFRSIGREIASYLPNLLMVLIIALLTRYVIKFCHYIFRAIEKGMVTFPGFYREWADPTYKIVRLLILAFSLVVMFPYVPGNESPAFKGLSIFFGVLFSLGSAGAVGNVVAGVLLTYTRAFQVGDRVKIADTVGDITEKTLLATRVRTIKNEEVTVPNSLVLGSHIINYSASSASNGLILHTVVTIGYDAPWRQVHELLISAALQTESVLREPPPFVLQTGLNDFYVSYQINAYTAEPNRMMQIYSQLHQNIQDKFNEAGVEICSPHFAALRDANRTTIPEAYLPKNYQAPEFRVISRENGVDGPGS